MGTHPIFESDFDCLTDMNSVYISSGGLVRELFPSGVAIRHNGRLLDSENFISAGSFVSISVKFLGGKGGYGQLLKDFGKETALSRNKKSCRDLSGRIVRDLDDIEDLKKWVKNNPARLERLKEERVKRLERNLIEPKHMMDSSRHSEQKETISVNQSAAFASFKKRKQEQDEETAAKPVKKKKWYEEEEPEEVKIPEIIVKSPAELRKQAFEDNERNKIWKKTGKKNFDLKSLSKKKVVVKNGAVIDAPDYVEETKPKEIWNDDFVESQDPDELKIIAIARREADFALAKQKEAEAATKTEAEKPKTDFSDIELEKIDSSEDLEKLGLDYLKFLLQLRKLKCGGTLTDRAKRLFSVKNLTPEQYPKKIKAK